MRRVSLFVGLALVLAGATVPIAHVGAQGPADDRPTHPECDLHPPIEVTENTGPDGFAIAKVPTTGKAIPRPGSGVLAGNGTADNPYVIEGWCIQHQLPKTGTSPSQTRDAIKIANTDAHVVIRNVTIETAFGQEMTVDRGIVLQNAENVDIEDSRVDDTTVVSAAGERLARLDGNLNLAGNSGIVVDGSQHVNLTDTRVDSAFVNGVRVSGSEDVQLTDNDLIGPFFFYGAKIASSSDVELDENRIREALVAGTLVQQTSQATVRDNAIQANTGGILGLQSPDLRIENNRLSNDFYSATLFGTDGVVVTHNNISSNKEVGLSLGSLDTATVTENEIRDNPIGIRIEKGTGYEVHQNNIEGNDKDGLRAIDVGATVNATDNWWGCPDGPTDPACDSVQGDVTFDPFLTSPNPGAGVS